MIINVSFYVFSESRTLTRRTSFSSIREQPIRNPSKRKSASNAATIDKNEKKSEKNVSMNDRSESEQFFFSSLFVITKKTASKKKTKSIKKKSKKREFKIVTNKTKFDLFVAEKNFEQLIARLKFKICDCANFSKKSSKN